MAVAIDLSGRVVLVCGAGGGIGQSVTRLMANAGATVVAIDHTQAFVDRAVADVESRGAIGMGIVADVRQRAQTNGLVPQVLERFGRIDGLVNVAGGTVQDQWREIERTPDDMVEQVMRFNFGYSFSLCREAARAMIDARTAGAIVNITSISGLVTAPYHAVYGAAKAALATATRTMALEWARHGIRVNSVAPGAVETERVLAQVGYERPDETWGRSVTQPEEIANGCLFLLSDLASGITGQNLVIDVGATIDYAVGGVAGMARKIFDAG